MKIGCYTFLCIIWMFRLNQVLSSKWIPRQHLLSRSISSVKLASYNVLSSSLCEPSYFRTCNPLYLAPEARLESLKVKLSSSVETRSIICLQEVSQKWTGDLHVYFSSRGYHLISAPYGNKFDGYMGVAIGVPLDTYEITNVDIKRVADTKSLPRAPKPRGFLNISKEILVIVLYL